MTQSVGNQESGGTVAPELSLLSRVHGPSWNHQKFVAIHLMATHIVNEVSESDYTCTTLFSRLSLWGGGKPEVRNPKDFTVSKQCSLFLFRDHKTKVQFLLLLLKIISILKYWEH